VETLSEVGIKTLLRFNPAGESSHQIIKLLTENSDRRLGGDASLYMDERYSLRFTFESPSTLATHLTNTTLSISSIPQLCQLLLDETERFLLGRICEVGRELCEPVNGAWFLDQLTSRSVGRWEGNVLDFRITFTGEPVTIRCSAHKLEGIHKLETIFASYDVNDGPLIKWVYKTISRVLNG